MAGGIKKKALLDDTYRIKRLSDGRLVWIDTGEYCLHITSSDGKALFRRTKEYQPVKVSEAYKEKLIVSQYGSKDKIPPGTTFIWPKYLPPIKYLETADNGWIIIQTTTEDARGWSRYDVFSGNVCEYIGSFYHPDGEFVISVKSNMAYFQAEDGAATPSSSAMPSSLPRNEIQARTRSGISHDQALEVQVLKWRPAASVQGRLNSMVR